MQFILMVSERRKAYQRDYFKRKWLFDPEFRKKRLAYAKKYRQTEAHKQYVQRNREKINAYSLKYSKSARWRKYSRERQSEVRQTESYKKWTKEYMKTYRQRESHKAYMRDYNKLYNKLDKRIEYARHWRHEKYGKKEYYENCQRCEEKAKTSINGRNAGLAYQNALQIT